MPQTLIKMRGAGTGGEQNAVANIDIPQDGTIEGLSIGHSANLNADSESSEAELSFIATNQITTNDARGVLAASLMNMGMATSGAGIAAVNHFIPMDVDVSGGERLYIHFLASAGVTSSISIMIHLRPSRAAPRRSSRRRQ